MTIRKVCILGGTGFIGGHIAALLHAADNDILIPTRHPHRHRDLQVLPRVKLVQADIHDKDQLKGLVRGADAVINLVGILNETGHDGRGFRRAHVELAQKVLEACKDTGVRRLLHMSALHADAANGPSHYLRSKGEAENHVHTFAGPVRVTSFRPSVVFGPGDSFLNRFARLLRAMPVAFPLTCPKARFQPVYVGDVARAFVAALEDETSHGRRYDLCGPRVYTLKELVAYTAMTCGLRRAIIGLPDGLSQFVAFLSEFILPGKFFSLDNYKSLHVDSVCPQGTQSCPTALEAIAPDYLGKSGRDVAYQAFRNKAGR